MSSFWAGFVIGVAFMSTLIIVARIGGRSDAVALLRDPDVARPWTPVVNGAEQKIRDEGGPTSPQQNYERTRGAIDA